VAHRRPTGGVESESANVLNDVADQPLGTRLVDAAGRELASAPRPSGWLPGPSPRAMANGSG
jgi:hypothetical protein